MFFMCALLMKCFIFPKLVYRLGMVVTLSSCDTPVSRQRWEDSVFSFLLPPHFPEYNNLAGWSSHHEPERIQTPTYLSGCYYGYHQSAINQSSTWIGQPAAARNNEGVSRIWENNNLSHIRVAEAMYSAYNFARHPLWFILLCKKIVIQI